MVNLFYKFTIFTHLKAFLWHYLVEFFFLLQVGL